MDLKGKRILVVGYGLSGQAATRLLLHYGARVVVIDESKKQPMKRRARRKKNPPIQIHFGASNLPRGRFDAAVISPGVPVDRGLGRKVADLDIPLMGELELASLFCQCPMVAITGTNGKTTTTELIRSIGRANGRKTLAAGNIGLPLSEAALKSDKLELLAVEASSFQLETIASFHPQVSVMLNITPDHLDRYRSFEEYAGAKAAIWKNQRAGDVAVVNLDTERYLKQLGHHPSCEVIRYSIRGEKVDLYLKDGKIKGRLVESAGFELNLAATRLLGAHNAENVMASLAVAVALGLNLELTWKAICDYKPLAHRLEEIAKIRGVTFVNDSKATNPDAMIKAIEAFDQPVVLIAGGKDKGFDFSGMTSLLPGKVKACVLLGEMQEKMARAWQESVACHFAGSMDEAVFKAAELACEGDLVLLSPGCSSFDMFKDFQDRGNIFKKAVLKVNRSQNLSS